ncbi:MAG: hypothetical protein AB1489_42040 [Acidobacteriota bacterium]
MQGGYCHLEYDVQAQHQELRFLLDIDLSELIAKINLTNSKNLKCPEEYLIPKTLHLASTLEEPQDFMPLLSVVLYLCSQAAELKDAKGTDHQLHNPKPQRTKHGLKTIPASHPTTWEVGYRLGATLRAAKQREESENQGGTHSRPRPHLGPYTGTIT